SRGLGDVYKRQGQGGRVIGVNFDGLRDAELKKSADGMGIRFTVLADDPAPRFKLPRSEALPVTYIVDARGEMRQRLLGEQTADGILKQLEALREGR
ncbi:TlpA family protein disulfide reductase, partial [Pseudomonas aeruginosa]|nr:TlpA family protein disulfide reductase [Pseudomonas aeruginosa]